MPRKQKSRVRRSPAKKQKRSRSKARPRLKRASRTRKKKRVVAARRVVRRRSRPRIKRRRPVRTQKTTRRRKVTRRSRRVVARRKPAAGGGRVAFQTNRQHEVFNELRALLIKASPASFPEIERALRKLGRVRLALITGAFLNVPDARVDLLIVGDNIRPQRLFHFIREQEADLGKELRYVTLERDEFMYRYEMFDRFLRDILDSPHYKLINTLRI